jgi:ubiquinone/menaquinone biosynthesis C-methylase UbiE
LIGGRNPRGSKAMVNLDSLTHSERARHLSNPEGEFGLAIAAVLNDVNRQEYDAVISLLPLTSARRVLEIGFGNGHLVGNLIQQAKDASYAGIDISPTMVDEANQFNAALVAAGRARFLLSSADEIPFGDEEFDSAFAIGVKHFWVDPAKPLAEIRRVLKPGGVSIMSSIHPRWAPTLPFARAEFGFHLRDNDEWAALHRAAGFNHVTAETIESQHTQPDGSTVARYGLRVIARR